MSQEEGKAKNILWWIGLIALIILVIAVGLYIRYNFWEGVFA
jgi:flagellar basal body-associated protein FliL